MPHYRLAAGDDCVECVAHCKVGLDVHLTVLFPMFTPFVQTWHIVLLGWAQCGFNGISYSVETKLCLIDETR